MIVTIFFAVQYIVNLLLKAFTHFVFLHYFPLFGVCSVSPPFSEYVCFPFAEVRFSENSLLTFSLGRCILLSSDTAFGALSDVSGMVVLFTAVAPRSAVSFFAYYTTHCISVYLIYKQILRTLLAYQLLKMLCPFPTPRTVF